MTSAVMNETGLKGGIAGEAIEPYRRVKLNATDGYYYLAGADDDDDGISDSKAEAAGDQITVRQPNVPGTRKVMCLTTCSKGARLFGAASGKVDDTSVAGVRSRYKALQACSAANTLIEVRPLNTSSGLRYASLADSATVTNTVVETAFDKSKTILSAELAKGDVLEVVARVRAPTTNSTDTLNVKLKFGTEVIAATGALNVTDNDIAYIHAFIPVREVGSSGKLSASGVTCIGVEGTATAKPFGLDEASEDLSTDPALTVTATWSVASASNICQLEDLIVIHHKA